MHAIDCQMHYEMYSETSVDGSDKIATFMQQMIPHHVNAVNMAKLLLTQATEEEIAAVDDLNAILLDIINTQNFQIHQFRNYLGGNGALLHNSDVVPPITKSAGARSFANASVLMASTAAVLIMMM